MMDGTKIRDDVTRHNIAFRSFQFSQSHCLMELLIKLYFLKKKNFSSGKILIVEFIFFSLLMILHVNYFGRLRLEA